MFWRKRRPEGGPDRRSPVSSAENTGNPSLHVQDPPVSDLPSRGPHVATQKSEPEIDALSRILAIENAEHRAIALHHFNRAQLGLDPDDGNFDRPPRPQRYIQV